MEKILILTHEYPPFQGGIATVAHGLAAGAAGLGYETHVLAPDYHGDTTDWDRVQPWRIARFPGATCSVVSLDKLTKFTATCRREIKLRRPDIVHAVDAPSQMALTALSKVRMARRYFFTVIGSELLRYRNDLMPRLWMRNAFRRVTGVAAISCRVLDYLVANFNVPRDRAFVSYPGIHPRWLEATATDRMTARQRWGLGGDDIVLLTVGRRVPDKGHRRVIEGLATLPAPLRQRLVYVVVGSGPEDYARALGDMATSAAVRLQLLGRISDEELTEAYDAADVFVMLSEESPKRLEGLGLVYIEAAARGLPSIGRDTGGVTEAVLDGKTGIVLPGQPTAEQVASALTTMAEDRELRDAMGERAKEFAAAFTWRRHAAEVYQRFASALGERYGG